MLCRTMLDTLPHHERVEIARLWQQAEVFRTSGNLTAASRGFQQLACLLPAVPDILLRWATITAQRSEHASAAGAFHRVAGLLPDQPDLKRNAAEQYWLSGEHARAMAMLAEAVQTTPEDSALWLTRTRFLKEAGDEEGAAGALRCAILLGPAAWQPVCQIGIDCANRGETAAAIRWQRRAMRLNPMAELPRRALSDAMRGNVSATRDAPLLRDLLDVVEQQSHRPRGLVRALIALIREEPAYQRAEVLLSARGTGADLEAVATLIQETGLPRLLGLELLPDQGVEEFITQLRRVCLEAWDEAGLPTGTRNLLEALAAHCQLHEYSLSETPAEVAAVARLRRHAREDENPLPLILLACFEPVDDVWAGVPELGDDLTAFRERHVAMPRRVRAAVAATERLTELAPGVSEAVGRQYEEDPYPRWTRPPGGGRGTLRERLQTLFPSRRLDFKEALQAPEVLIAGCGTGQEACALAAGYPDAAITAVDLSRASLAYARCKAEDFGLGNVSFGQADILRLGDLGREFDFIESVGVLHHMEYPEQGLRVLAGLLRPGGVMHLGFYSRRGRVAVSAARDLIADWGLAPTAAGIREARQRLFALRETRPDLTGLFISPDFYARPSCRDLIFHVQEHQYDVPGLRSLIEGTGLELLGFELQSERRTDFLGRFPNDPEICDWASIDSFERAVPWAFSEMYRFWLIKR